MLTVQHIHLQHKGGALKPISSVGARRLKLHSVHSCPNGDKWQVNTPNGLSLYWSAAHFSFHNNNARGESSLLGLLVREWLGEEIGPVIILSSTCPSCGVPPSLTRRLLNPDEILTQQRLACYSWSHHCTRMIVSGWSDTEGLVFIGISIMRSIYNAARCMKWPIW